MSITEKIIAQARADAVMRRCDQAIAAAGMNLESAKRVWRLALQRVNSIADAEGSLVELTEAAEALQAADAAEKSCAIALTDATSRWTDAHRVAENIRLGIKVTAP